MFVPAPKTLQRVLIGGDCMKTISHIQVNERIVFVDLFRYISWDMSRFLFFPNTAVYILHNMTCRAADGEFSARNVYIVMVAIRTVSHGRPWSFSSFRGSNEMVTKIGILMQGFRFAFLWGRLVTWRLSQIDELLGGEKGTSQPKSSSILADRRDISATMSQVFPDRSW